MKHTAWLALLLFIVAGRALAQTDCPAIVQTALEIASEACTNLGRNQACYGNVTLEAQSLTGAALTFEHTGDTVNLDDVVSLHLSAMDTNEASWGIALLRTQANLPDTLPGQNVSMVLFGAVEMTDAAPRSADATPEPAPIAFPVSISKTVNVRSIPQKGGEIVAPLKRGSTVPTDGRNEDGTWLHVQLEDGSTGWVLASLVSVDGDISQLPVTDGAAEEAAGEASYAPMQAFYFNSGIGDSACAQAPDSGILIQTPEGARTINLLINEVAVTLGSTAYVQAGDGEMTVSVVEGEGTVSAFGTTVTVMAGTRARIPLDGNGVASGAPIGAEPYDATSLITLPLTLLPQQVTVATPLTEAEIAARQPLYVGTWVFRASTNCNLIRGEVSFTLDFLQAPSEEPTWAEVPTVDSADDLYIGYLLAENATEFLNQLQKDQQITIPGHYTQARADGPALEVDVLSPTSITARVPVIVSDGFCIASYTIDAVTAGSGDVQTTASNTLYQGNWNMTATFACGVLGEGEVIIPFDHSGSDFTWDTSMTDLQNALGVLYPLPEGFTQALYDLERNHKLTIPGQFTLSEGGIAVDINIVSATSVTGTLNYAEVSCVMDVALDAVT